MLAPEVIRLLYCDYAINEGCKVSAMRSVLGGLLFTTMNSQYYVKNPFDALEELVRLKVAGYGVPDESVEMLRRDVYANAL